MLQNFEINVPDPIKEEAFLVDEEVLNKTLSDTILSPSGWRGIFSDDGNEESKSEKISPAYTIIASAGAKVFADYLKANKNEQTQNAIIVGMDTRPTSKSIAEIMIRTFSACGFDVRFAFITSAPEIMAYSKSAGEKGLACGFAYISASHNPIGHNGIKFGLIDGGVLSSDKAKLLISNFHSFMSLPDRVLQIQTLLKSCDQKNIEKIYKNINEIKKESYCAYFEFAKEVVIGSNTEIFNAISAGLRENPLGIVVDFNGSARTVSIDRDFFSSLGINCYAINDKAGEIAHRIVPEGESLDPCCRFLEETHKKYPDVILGYVPDCDGDRGNLVIWDEGFNRARSLEAQEVFALACVAELAHLVWTGELNSPDKKAAIAVNDPTSMRIERIARTFGVSVFYAEVGEANVVGLARKLREEGYVVRILGEGSAGGNITHPSAVRDPINTVMALVKLLSVRSKKDKKGFFELWCNKSNQVLAYKNSFSLFNIISSIPKFTTTGSYTEEAVLKVKTKDHVLLKNNYQAIFLKEWEDRKMELKSKYNIHNWFASRYNGMEEKKIISSFGEAGSGGLKITFINGLENKIAWIWLRGSATEPVFRMMADAESFYLERYLIKWQRQMLIKADE